MTQTGPFVSPLPRLFLGFRSMFFSFCCFATESLKKRSISTRVRVCRSCWIFLRNRSDDLVVFCFDLFLFFLVLLFSFLVLWYFSTSFVIINC